MRRIVKAYRVLERDQRQAAAAAAALLLTMFLPWYEKSVVIRGTRTFTNDSISAFGAVSFVEAAIFLVSAGVLGLLFARADERPFHLPGGDGNVIFAAGLWATLLIFYRVFDRPNISGDGGTVGIQWGFFVSFVAAGALAVAGQRIRAAHRPEPRRRARRERPPTETPPPAPVPDDDWVQPERARTAAAEAQTAVVPASEARTDILRKRPPSSEPPDRRVTRADAEGLTFEDPPAFEDR